MIDQVKPTDRERYQAKQKLFGERASRLDQDEYPAIAQAFLQEIEPYVEAVCSPVQLSDKPSLGDVDLIAQSEEPFNEDFFRVIFGDRLIEYSRNGETYSLLIRISDIRAVHVDYIRATNGIDRTRKEIYYSKGHTSPIIGMLSKSLNFKYGTEGFFKRYCDSKGQWHDIKITDDLFEGMQILGLDPEAWEHLDTIDDIARFISSSPYFTSEIFEEDNLVRRDREQIQRIASQEYIIAQLRALRVAPGTMDEDELFKKILPEQYDDYIRSTEQIEVNLKQRRAINGRILMTTLNIPQGRLIGQALSYLGEHYPDATELTDEIILELKTTLGLN